MKTINTILAIAVMIFNFGVGFKLTEIVNDIRLRGYSYNEIFPLSCTIILLFVLCYKTTYKVGNYSLFSAKFWFIVLAKYVVPLMLGVLFWYH